MILYENTKATDGSTDRDTDFDVDAAVQQRDILAYFLFINCLAYGLQTSIDLTKKIILI